MMHVVKKSLLLDKARSEANFFGLSACKFKLGLVWDPNEIILFRLDKIISANLIPRTFEHGRSRRIASLMHVITLLLNLLYAVRVLQQNLIFYTVTKKVY